MAWFPRDSVSERASVGELGKWHCVGQGVSEVYIKVDHGLYWKYIYAFVLFICAYNFLSVFLDYNSDDAIPFY